MIMNRLNARPAPLLLAWVAAVFVLSGCQKVKDVFSDTNKQEPLKGERISVLEYQRQIAPETVTAPVEIEPAAVNADWPQLGGNPEHRPGHAALAASVERAWLRTIGARATKYNPMTVSPVIAENTVYALDSRGHLTSTDLITGKLNWYVLLLPEDKKNAPMPVGGGLAYDDGRLYVTAGGRALYAINPKNGAKVWQAALPTVGRIAPTIRDGRIYVVLLDNSLAVFSTQDGNRLWTYAGVMETTSLLGAAAVAVDDSLVVLPMSSGELFGLRPENGRVVWQDNLSTVTGGTLTISDIVGLPVIDGDMVFTISFGGKIVAIDKVTGLRRWQREIGGTETPLVSGNTVFVVSEQQQLVALDRDTGAIRWVSQLKNFRDADRKRPIVWSGPVLAGGRLWVVSGEAEMLEVSPADGKTLKTHEVPTGSDVPPVVAGNTLVVLNKFGELMAWR
jgi:outer membrane protein assembly factor BamB